MSAALLDGKALSARMRERLGQEAAALPRQPGLAVILVGDNPASAVYVRNKEKDCAQCGVRCLNHHLPAETTQQELLERMELFCHLCAALNSLPETQGRRVDACVILGKSYSKVARAEGVHESAVRRSVERGLEKMKQYLKKCL